MHALARQQSRQLRVPLAARLARPCLGDHLRAGFVHKHHGWLVIFVDTEFVRASGLGNRLFPWARSRIAARQLGARCVSADWGHLRRGPLLRGGIDYLHAARKILLLDNFMRAPGEVAGIRKRLLRSRLPAVSEAELTTDARPSPSEGLRIVFRGDGAHFADLHAEQAFVRARFHEIVKPKWHKLVRDLPHAPIGLNIRLGRDFAVARSPRDFVERGAVQTPVSWFVDALRTLRAITRKALPAIVVTDGTPRQLAPLLALPDVHYCRTPAAATDLLALARARFLVGTGGSSFTAWAAFLGQIPIVSIPGQSFRWFKLGDPAHGPQAEELDPLAPSDAVRALIHDRLGR